MRKKFNALVATVALALAAPFAQAAQPFAPYSPTGEKCPAPDSSPPLVWTTPTFNAPARDQMTQLAAAGLQIGRNKPDGRFNERATASVNEFRLLAKGEDFRDSLTAKDLTDLKAFAARVKQDMKRHGIGQQTATALRFAADRTDADFTALLAEHKKGFAPDVDTWLHLVHTYGDKYGLGYYRQNSGDPLVFEQTLALRDHPRIAAVMMAEYLLHKDAPAAVTAATPDQGDVQGYLQTLGFDLGDEAGRGSHGPMTAAALAKFDRLYMPAASFFGASAASDVLRLFARQAEKDALAYGISTPAAAAIRLANIRTRADFGYMMELSSAESSFDPAAKAKKSSATGLYQFTEDTWLHMLRRYGAKYGLEALSSQIESKRDMYGLLVARVENPFVRATLLELRKDPHLAALMSAEFQMRNKFLVECAAGHELNRTEQYLAHFLGSRGGAHFLNRMAENPNLSGARMFPAAAKANKNIFYARDKKGRLMPRTLKQIYNRLDGKFETGNYEDHGEKIAPENTGPESPQL